MLSAEFTSESRDKSAIPEGDLSEIAVAGRSNVGKSTLLNCIVQRHNLARVSRTPGCTRGIVMFDLAFRNGTRLRLVDLPGYGYASRSKTERRAWGPLIEDYLIERGVLRGVLILVDARRGPEAEEIDLADYLRVLGVPYVLVATKTDKMSRSERGVALEKMAKAHHVRVYGVSGETGEGRQGPREARRRYEPRRDRHVRLDVGDSRGAEGRRRG
ncbi:MAG: ribosome biogenesis GTP-binding protein YihA/YsxC [Deltaproteobacteria bacterium]